MGGVSSGLVRIVSSDQRIQRAETCRAPCAGCETDQRAIRTGIAIRIQTGDRRDLEAIMAVFSSSLKDRERESFVDRDSTYGEYGINALCVVIVPVCVPLISENVVRAGEEIKAKAAEGSRFLSDEASGEIVCGAGIGDDKVPNYIVGWRRRGEITAQKIGRRNLNRLKGAQTCDVAGQRPGSAQEVEG
jgi:hypothetical protein